jgi:putative restriction endonuclease
MFYWVNQGKTYKEEREGGYLWAPIKNDKGSSFFHWSNMKKLNPGNVVYNYFKGYLVGYCIIKSGYYEAPRPTEFKVDDIWENEGMMVDAEYFPFKQPLGLSYIYQNIQSFLPDKYSPINVTLNNDKLVVKANQGYLYELKNLAGQKILDLANLKTNALFELNDSEKNDYTGPDVTSRRGLVTSRIGQGEYRRKILQRWNYQCAVSGSKIKEVLIASHILPWRDSNNYERLDVHNGILLSPVYDALFDKYLISFNDQGEIIISPKLKKYDLSILGISGTEKIDGLTDGNKIYLRKHREKLTEL